MSTARSLSAVSILIACAGAAPSGEPTANPPPTLRVVFFTPSDLEPPAGVGQRLTRVADAAERFIVGGMRRWDYTPAQQKMFQRLPNGGVEVLYLKGDHPKASGRYDKPDYAPKLIDQATRRYAVPGENNVWLIFVYLGDPPTRFNEYKGSGDSALGGWAMVNYDSTPGEIRPDLSLAEGFNQQFTLKAVVHELGHAFGLPHIGPNPGKGLGNSLMGPQTKVYAERYSRPNQVYLTEASAAMLWKHPLFSGTSKGRGVLPSVRLDAYRAAFIRSKRKVTLTGKLVSNQPAHSAVVLDDAERKQGSYWTRGYVGRVKADGTFTVVIDEPQAADGLYRIYFCFENGVATGDGKGHGDQSAVQKSYRLVRGALQFGP